MFIALPSSSPRLYLYCLIHILFLDAQLLLLLLSHVSHANVPKDKTIIKCVFASLCDVHFSRTKSGDNPQLMVVSKPVLKQILLLPYPFFHFNTVRDLVCCKPLNNHWKKNFTFIMHHLKKINFQFRTVFDL